MKRRRRGKKSLWWKRICIANRNQGGNSIWFLAPTGFLTSISKFKTLEFLAAAANPWCLLLSVKRWNQDVPKIEAGGVGGHRPGLGRRSSLDLPRPKRWVVSVLVTFDLRCPSALLLSLDFVATYSGVVSRSGLKMKHKSWNSPQASVNLKNNFSSHWTAKYIHDHRMLKFGALSVARMQ